MLGKDCCSIPFSCFCLGIQSYLYHLDAALEIPQIGNQSKVSSCCLFLKQLKYNYNYSSGLNNGPSSCISASFYKRNDVTRALFS